MPSANAIPGGGKMPIDRGAYGKKPIGGGIMAKPAFSPFGDDLFGQPIQPDAKRGPLAQRFEFPPFSILNAQQGAWQERKAAWLSLGIKSEIGRGGGYL